jgi:hypothetical protein
MKHKAKKKKKNSMGTIHTSLWNQQLGGGGVLICLSREFAVVICSVREPKFHFVTSCYLFSKCRD